MTSFFSALAFLTRLPVGGSNASDLADAAAPQAWFPAVGLILGALLLALDRLASRALPVPSVDVLVVVALAGMTGALHLDGLADAADGLLGAHDQQRRLAIMRDEHAGAFAIVAVVSVLALKWAGLAALPASVRFEALLLTPCLARLAMLVAVAAFPCARTNGMAAALRKRTSAVAVTVGGATALGASVTLLGAVGVYTVAFAVASGLAAGGVGMRTVGGMTGDLYGATVEVGEAFLLLFLAAMANRGWLEAWLLR